jgi:hypothetical protein
LLTAALARHSSDIRWITEPVELKATPLWGAFDVEALPLGATATANKLASRFGSTNRKARWLCTSGRPASFIHGRSIIARCAKKQRCFCFAADESFGKCVDYVDCAMEKISVGCSVRDLDSFIADAEATSSNIGSLQS